MAASNQFISETFVPEDIIVNHILPKLPPKSLIRYQCVKKLWKSIISDPNFKISAEYRNRALVFSSGRCKLLNNNFSIPFSIKRSLEDPLSPVPHTYSRIFGSCNGLVMYSTGIDIFLWNPITSYCLKVLELEFLSIVSSLVCGFCYDTSSDDYVVLVAISSNRTFISANLKSKKWRPVIFSYDIGSIVDNMGCIVNNLLHWLASSCGLWGLLGKPNSVIYYDVPSNKFHNLPSPDPIKENGNELVGLGVLEYHLCLMRLYKCDVEVLVMKEYGVKESWTPMFCIRDVVPYPESYLRRELLLYSLKLDVFLFQMNFSFLAYYPSSGIKEEIDILDGLWYKRVIPYVASLVSPTGYYWNERYDKKMTSTTSEIALQHNENHNF